MAVNKLWARFQPPMKKPTKKYYLVVVCHLWHWVAPLPLPICGFPPPASRYCRGALPLSRAGICRMHDVTLNWLETAEWLGPGTKRLFFGGELKLELFSSHFPCTGFIHFGIFTTCSGQGFGSGASSQPHPAAGMNARRWRNPGQKKVDDASRKVDGGTGRWAPSCPPLSPFGASDTRLMLICRSWRFHHHYHLPSFIFHAFFCLCCTCVDTATLVWVPSWTSLTYFLWNVCCCRLAAPCPRRYRWCWWSLCGLRSADSGLVPYQGAPGYLAQRLPSVSAPIFWQASITMD